MEYLLQLLIILGFTFAGEALNRLIPLPVPAAVYGLVLLFLALSTGLVKVEKIKTVGNWLCGPGGQSFGQLGRYQRSAAAGSADCGGFHGGGVWGGGSGDPVAVPEGRQP